MWIDLGIISGSAKILKGLCLNYYEDLSGGGFLITTPENFGQISELIEKKGIEFDGQITLIPKNIVEVSKDSADKIVKVSS